MSGHTVPGGHAVPGGHTVPGGGAEAGCCLCGRALTRDEVAMTRRLVRKTADEFFCLGCLSEELDIPAEELERKMAYFKAIGCTLFMDARRIAV